MYPPNLPSIPPPPQQPLSGRPATPRMLRSISGTLKSKTELAHSDKGQESNNETKNSNSLTMYLIHIPDNHHQNHSNQIFKLQQLFMGISKRTVVATTIYSKSKHNETCANTNWSRPTTCKTKPLPAPKQPQPQQQQQQQQQQQFHRKSIGDWNFVKTIGAGSMGKVKLAQHNATHEICAVKIIPRAAKLYQRAHANDPPPQTTQKQLRDIKSLKRSCERQKNYT